MLEKDFTNKICKQLREIGAVVVPLVASEKSLLGCPDRLVIHWIWTGLLEFKAQTTVVRAHQRKLMREIKKRQKRFVYVVRHNPIGTFDMASIVESPDGSVVAKFDGSGEDLLRVLSYL